MVDYKTAGVDVDRGEAVVKRIKQMMGASGSVIGHFGGAVPLPQSSGKKQLLVSSIDGVGTKIKIASAVKIYSSIGSDLVHHSINDLACCGAEPIAFLDYIAAAKLDVDIISEVIGGIINACQNWDVMLAGGETAEMPGVYCENEMDLAGSIFGVVNEDEFISGKNISTGDLLIGFPSNGLHTNGYSLARRVLSDHLISYTDKIDDSDETWGDALLKVHTCYLPQIRLLKNIGGLKGLAHITGGGIVGNLSRVVPKHFNINLDWNSWQTPGIFNKLIEIGSIPLDDARRTFNMGIGLIAVIKSSQQGKITTALIDSKFEYKIIGKID